MYVSCSEKSISAILVTESGGIQNPVFYLSRTLQGADFRYPLLKKLALAIVISAKRLRIYFQTYQIIIPTSYPLLQTLNKPDVLGRLAKWAIELSGYDIKFIPTKTIKVQVLAELTSESKIEEEEEEMWSMKVDGSIGKSGCEAGIVLENKEELQLEHVVHFDFQATNNVAEYEALVAGLEIAKELGIKNLKVYTDSQLVANQAKGNYEIKEQNLKDYKELVVKLMKSFKTVKLNLVKREFIEEVDALAKLGAAKSIKHDKWIQVRTLPFSSIQYNKENLEISSEVADWRSKIKNFILGTEIPDNKLELKKVRNQATHYVLLEEDLYRREVRTRTFPLRICV